MEPGGAREADRDRGHVLALAAVAALALFARAMAAVGEPILFNDGPRFIDLAEALRNGEIWTALAHDFPPLTSLLMLGLAAPTGLDLETAGRLLSVLSGVHLALFLVAALLAWRALEAQRPGRALASGLACGLAYLARPEGLAVGVVVAAWLGADVLGRRLSLRRGLALSLAFALGLALTAGPYFTALRSLRGEWTLSQKKSVVSIVRVDTSLASRPELRERLRLFIEAAREVAMDGLSAAHSVPLVLCFFGLRPGRPRRSTLFFASFLGLFLFLLLGLRLSALYVSRRHWITVAALMLPFAARGALTLESALVRFLPRASARVVPAVAAVILLVGLGVRGVAPGADADKRARRDAALWLREHAPGRALAAPRSRLAYYAAASRFLPFPPGPASAEVIEALLVQGADYVILDARALEHFGTDEVAPAREVHRVPYTGGEVLVLALKPDY
jgi:hypothetical protein